MRYLICVLLRGLDTIFTLGDLMVALLIALFLGQIAREHGIRFFETSAKANINIEKAFLTLAEDILKKVGAHRSYGVLATVWIHRFHSPVVDIRCSTSQFGRELGLTTTV